MGNTKVWLLLFALLCFVLQVVLDLSNHQFLLLLVIWSALFLIIVWITHSDEVPADEARNKVIDTVKKWVEKLQEQTKS